jgi:hypothetical protein
MEDPIMNWRITVAALLNYLLDRSKERSTYLGLIALAGSLGVMISPELAQVIMAGVGSLCGIILLVTRDKTATSLIEVAVEPEGPASPAKTEKTVLRG